jgi:hypothetical protein
VTGGNIDLENSISQDNVQAFTYTANPEEKLSVIQLELPINTIVNFTLYYGSSSTVSGWANYRVNTILVNSFSEVSLGGNTYSEVFIDPLISGYSTTKHIQFTSYARNDTTTVDESGFAVYAQGYGIFSSELAFFPVADLPSNLIYRVDIIANQPISITVDTARADILAAYASSTVAESRGRGVEGVVTSIVEFVGMVAGIISGLLYWMKVIFVDNFVLTMVMYFMGTLAVAMNTSKNIFQAFGKFFKWQVMLFNFVISAFKSMIEMAISIKQFIPGLKYL